MGVVPKPSQPSDLSLSLEANTALLRKIELLGNLGTWEIDLLTGKHSWSDQLFRIFGRESGSFHPSLDGVLELIHPEDRNAVNAAYQKSLETGRACKIETRIIWQNGEVRNIVIDGTIDLSSERKPVRVVWIFRDRTDEKRMEDKLRRSNLQIDNILNTTQDLIFLTDENGYFLKVSKSCDKILGYPCLELIGKSFKDLVHPDDYEATLASRDKLMEGLPASDFQNRYFKKDGSIVYLNWSASLDVSSKSNERFHLATQAVSDAIWDWDMENDYVFWAKGYKRLFGYVEEQVPVNFWKSRIHPDDFPAILESIAEARNNKSADRWSGEYRFMRFDGSYAFVKENLVILRNEEGIPHRMVGELQDITEEKEKENHLKLLESVVTHTSDGVLITEAEPGDIGYKIIYANDQFYQMTGYTSEDILGNTPAMFQGPLTDRSVLKQLKQDLQDKKPSTVELINYRKDGSTYWVNFFLTPIANQKGNYTHWISVQRDVSLQKKNQAALAQKTRLIVTTAEIIQSLLETNDWEESISDILIRMGVVIDADRVYLFKNFVDSDTGKLASQQLQEWTNGKGIVKYDGTNLLTIYLEDHPLLLDAAGARHTLSAKTTDMVGITRYLLDLRNSKSVIQIPFYVMGEFYGFLGFDDCRTERDWTDDEIGFLTSISTNLAFAIEREINMDKVQEALESRKALLESIGDSFYALDKNYNVTYWNNVVEKLTGVKREDILGRNVWDFVEIQNEKFKVAYEKALRDNEAQYFETFDPWVKAWLEVTIYPAHGGLSAIVKDITARKNAETQLAESNQRFSILSDAINDAIWDWNIDTNEHYWGEGFQKLFGIDIEVEGASPDFWHKRVHPDDLPFVEESLKRLLSIDGGSYFESEYRFQRQDGTYAYVIDKSSVIRNKEGVALRVVGVIMDISQRKTYEESLKKLNEELANSNRELEISNKELEQFAYVASHDLQEPLRMISSFLGLIERKYQEKLDDKGRQYIHFAVDGARRMRDIILDLLDFSRVGSYTEPKKIVSGNDMIKEVLLLTKKAIQETNAIIRIGPLPDIFCHSSSIIQLFQNLVSNALKYQAPGNTPEITITSKELDEDWLFSVQDNGIGIDPQFKDKIFVIFQRLHQKEQFSGSGIGLSICKKIVEFHGGKIWVESTLGEGCTFFFTLKK
jgi:PAS domain S-box-containing protein